jgi:cell division transport system ATP-binding protein
MIQFLQVTKIYNTKPKPIIALDDVSFEINEGEFIFLVGNSGSGKTTVLRQIIREELPTKGKIFFEDEDITQMKRADIYKLRRQIGTVFQDYKLIEEKNAYENVAFAMEAASFPQKEIEETVPYVLDIVNLSDRAESFPDELSGGEKQRVAIARALVNNPKLLIADEPTGNLDPDSSWDVVQVLDKINKWGTTVIMSTHGTEIVNSLQKRVIKLEKGKLIRDDKKGEYDKEDEFALKVLKSEEKDEKAKEQEKSKKPIKTAEKITPKDTKDKKDQKQNKPKQPKVTKAEEKKLDKLIHKADTSSLSILKLNKKLEAKLRKKKYKDVEDILSAGIAKVNKHLKQNEVRELAKSIKKFVTSE